VQPLGETPFLTVGLLPRLATQPEQQKFRTLPVSFVKKVLGGIRVIVTNPVSPHRVQQNEKHSCSLEFKRSSFSLHDETAA
jgi:hypothetical protein